MPAFNNEYHPRLGRPETNRFVSGFVQRLMDGLVKTFDLSLAVAPLFTGSRHSLMLSDNLRSIDFDNAFSNDIFKTVDLIDRWMYLHVRQSAVKINTGLICLNHQVFRDANVEDGRMIAAPFLSFCVSVQRLDYTDAHLVEQTRKAIKAINDAIAAAWPVGTKPERSVTDFGRQSLPEMMRFGKKMHLRDLLIHHCANRPLLLSDYAGHQQFEEFFAYAKNPLIHRPSNHVLFQYDSQKNQPLDFLTIHLQPTYEALRDGLDPNNFFDVRLGAAAKNVEWTYLANVNLANVLLWALGKQHHAEIFPGPHGDDFYDAALSDGRDVV